MAAETYSLAPTGRGADQLFAINEITIGDTAGRASSQARAMSLNTQVMCKNPDGSKSWYTIDAERSTASNVVLKAV